RLPAALPIFTLYRPGGGMGKELKSTGREAAAVSAPFTSTTRAAAVTPETIDEARLRIGGQVVHTPCTSAEGIGELFGGNVWLKFENLQRTGSFKDRGALNRMLAIPASERGAGVIAASAGNHAQGVAYHAGRLGLRATIVMPERSPLIKVANTERFGARVLLF